MPFSATAFICCFNEADIIWYTLKHLTEQGINVHIIDNWSFDVTADLVHEFKLSGYEKFPPEGPSQYYSWKPLLERVEKLAYQSDANWCILHDADEIRRSPRKEESLLDGFARVDKENYTAVNFQVYHFMPVDDLYSGDPEEHFKYYTLEHGDCRMRQVKAWRKMGGFCDLASSGGHFADFPGVNVHPQKFILKHYPIRSSEHAERKVMIERIPRYDPIELALHWHVQYQNLAVMKKWLQNPETLQLWEQETA